MLICWDSLRLDSCEPFRGLLNDGNESWTDIPSLDGFTGPILPSICVGKSPEELGIPRTDEAFYSGINPSKIDDTIFDHMGSHITISRLIGNPDMPHQTMVPSRREHFTFMPPLNFNAISNWEINIWNYFGQKWSMSNPYWIDSIFFWSFIVHGCYSIYTSEGKLESPEICGGDRLNQRLARENPQKLRDLYMMGVYNAAATLKGLNEICNGQELIICFSDHNEALGEEYNGQICTGHFHGMEKIPGLERVPIWCNKPNIKFPENMKQTDIKNWVKEMFKKYELDNSEYQSFKQKKLAMVKK